MAAKDPIYLCQKTCYYKIQNILKYGLMQGDKLAAASPYEDFPQQIKTRKKHKPLPNHSNPPSPDLAAITIEQNYILSVLPHHGQLSASHPSYK